MTRTKLTFPFDSTTTNLTQKVNENGLINSLILKVPNYTNAITVTRIDMYDTDDDVFYSNTTGWAKNANYLITGLAIPMDMNYYVKVTLSGAAGGTGGNAVVKLFLERK